MSFGFVGFWDWLLDFLGSALVCFGIAKFPAGVQFKPPEAKSNLPSGKSLSLALVFLPDTQNLLFCTKNSCGIGAGGKLPCFSGFLGVEV